MLNLKDKLFSDFIALLNPESISTLIAEMKKYQIEHKLKESEVYITKNGFFLIMKRIFPQYTSFNDIFALIFNRFQHRKCGVNSLNGNLIPPSPLPQALICLISWKLNLFRWNYAYFCKIMCIPRAISLILIYFDKFRQNYWLYIYIYIYNFMWTSYLLVSSHILHLGGHENACNYRPWQRYYYHSRQFL